MISYILGNDYFIIFYRVKIRNVIGVAIKKIFKVQEKSKKSVSPSIYLYLGWVQRLRKYVKLWKKVKKVSEIVGSINI